MVNDRGVEKTMGFKGLCATDFTGIPEMIEHGMGDLQTVSLGFECRN
jgi:beta-glucosidase